MTSHMPTTGSKSAFERGGGQCLSETNADWDHQQATWSRIPGRKLDLCAQGLDEEDLGKPIHDRGPRIVQRDKLKQTKAPGKPV
jgi:hypothetical protein